MPKAKRVSVEVGERTLSLSNLDKVMYPETGMTKAGVIDYYVRIAPTMLIHVAHRGITMIRWPDGVDGKSFFEKRCPSHHPDWVPVALGPGDGCLLYTSPSPRDATLSRMPSSA